MIERANRKMFLTNMFVTVELVDVSSFQLIFSDLITSWVHSNDGKAVRVMTNENIIYENE